MSAAKKSSKAALAPASEHEDMIIEYLQKTNRPYSAIDIFNNLKERIPKTAVVKLCTQLVESNKIHGKQYGKQWVFVTRQEDLPAPSQAELNDMDAKMEALKAQLQGLIEENKQVQTELSELNAAPTDEELTDQLAALEKETQDLQDRLETLTSGQVQVSVEDKKKIDADYDKMRGLWKARKKMFKGVFDIIGESLPGKPAAFFEELGIETDEMVGMDINRDPL